jgi:hypothetical protein
MPRINTSQQGAIFTFDSEDWIKGLAINGQFGNVPFTGPAIGTGAIRLQNINPFSPYGILQPGRAATNVPNNSALGGVVISGVVQGSQYAYLVDGAGKVQRYDYQNPLNGLTNAGSFPHTITGTSPVGQDVTIYRHNSGGTTTQVFSAFYSYYNNANWDVGAYVNLTTFDDDFMSTIPATPLDITSGDGDSASQRTSPHCLEIGSDDILYIGSGRYIHAYDGATGADGTFSARVLTLPAGFTVVALKKFQDVMLIAGNYNTDTTNNIGGEALLYVWNYIDLDITQAIPLEDPAVVSLFLWKGNPHVICVGEKEGRGTNKLKALVGNTIVLRTTFDFPTPPINRGVDASSDVVYVNCGGNIVQLGDPFSGELTAHHITTCNSAAFSGWVKNFGVEPSTNLNYGLVASSASALSGGTNSLATFLTSWQTTCLYRTNFEKIPVPPGKNARLKNIIVEHYRAFSNADFSFNVYYNYSDSSLDGSTIFTNQTTLIAPLTKQYKNDSSNAPLKEATTFRFEFNWSNIATASANPPAPSRVTFVFEYLDLQANT